MKQVYPNTECKFIHKSFIQINTGILCRLQARPGEIDKNFAPAHEK